MTKDGTTRFALVGSYVPRRCGIATFGHDLVSALAGDAPSADERPRIVAPRRSHRTRGSRKSGRPESIPVTRRAWP